MLSTSNYKIHTYNNNYCLNDAVIQCNISTNPKEYIDSISDKIIHNFQSYVSKDKLCDILSKSKMYKSKELLKYLQNADTTKEELEIVELTNKSNELINFVNYKESVIQFNNKPLKYFIYNEQFYFKAKDVAEILEYSDMEKSIIDHVHKKDKFTKNYFISGLKGGESPPFKIVENNIKSNEEVGGSSGVASPQSLEKESNIISISPIEVIENTKLKKYLEKEYSQTIFINEIGFNNLITNSKKKEANAFKIWVASEVLPSIRKNGTYISNKLIEYNKDEFKNYYNKDCVYILHIKDNIYKYGKTSDIQDRFYRHKRNLKYTNIEKIYVLNSINEINVMENDIKEFTKMNKINLYYNHGIEFFECTPNLTLDKVIEQIDALHKKIKKNTNSSDLLLEKILEKLDNFDMRLTMLEKADKSIINNTGKCIDCMKEATKFAIRCGKCERKNKLKLAMEDGTKPTHAQLKKDLNELRFVSHIAKKYNVTSRTINKWLANYEKYNQLIQKPEEQEPVPQTATQPATQPTSATLPVPQTAPQPAPQSAIHPATPVKDPIDNKKKKCLDCTKMVFKKCTRCNECNNKYKIKTQATESNRPSLEQLKNDLKELKSMVQVGVKYKVSDNAVRKWIRNYEKL